MSGFSQLNSYERFEQIIKNKSRFGIDVEVRDFIRVVLDTAKKRQKQLRQGLPLFRAARGCDTEQRPINSEDGEQDDEEVYLENECALSSERMVPKAEYVGDGRANPKRIPCLYLATKASAAISEMRPWVGSFLTLAQFKTTRILKMVDCSENTIQSFALQPHNFEESDKTEEVDPSTKEKGV